MDIAALPPPQRCLECWKGQSLSLYVDRDTSQQTCQAVREPLTNGIGLGCFRVEALLLDVHPAGGSHTL